MIEDNDIDIVMGCESHLDDSYFTSEVFPSNFTIYRKDRCAGGGGVFVAIRDDLKSFEDPIIDVSAELVWAKLCISGMVPVYVCAFYRPPNSDMEPITQLKNFLTLYLMEIWYPSLYLMEIWYPSCSANR